MCVKTEGISSSPLSGLDKVKEARELLGGEAMGLVGCRCSLAGAKVAGEGVTPGAYGSGVGLSVDIVVADAVEKTFGQRK